MVDYLSGDLLIEGSNYYLQNKKRFLAYATILDTDKKSCFDFAYDMSYGEKGEHRYKRSGGSANRTKGQIFINTFQGKLAEYALYRYLLSKNIDTTAPDVSEYERGVWDAFDLDCQGKHISVKSTKSYGNLLLLEKEDWNEKGEYLPNKGSEVCTYDYTVLVRFYPDGEAIMKANHLLLQRDFEIPSNIHDILCEKVMNVTWQYDFAGFIYFSELVKMIKENHSIPKGSYLNGRTKMDADNYYFQAGNMHSMPELYTGTFGSKDDRADLRLKRTCPKCGGKLVIRNGRYSLFWGCTGFFTDKKCCYTEPITQ
ncbi:MAG: topoisomerase DNA-binding C4 zinc finger domain-containing protein [Lachnospiraceae bacterium]|nr:topoisomerase DNA-binding C4 zinc finger domain-containing protein [Lachnospiraceae bacterium]